MKKKPNLLSMIPSAEVVRQTLRDARQHVVMLERLLVAAESIESHTNSENTSCHNLK